MRTKWLAILLLCVLVTAAYAAKRSSTNYGIQSDGITQVGAKSTSESYILRVGAGTQLATKENSSNYTAYAGYIYQTNTKPGTPESLTQYKADGATQIPWPAGWTNTSTEVFRADISDPDPGDILVFQVEVLLSGESFTDTPSVESDPYDYSGTSVNASVSATSMEHAQSYVWQARVKDLENYYSDWVTLGGEPDYRVDLVPPGIPLDLVAYASPETNPSYVYMTWLPTTDALSGVAGYNVYRSNVPWTGYTEYYSLLTDTSTEDGGVSVGENYYYVVAAEDEAGGVGDYSNQASAPHMNITREATVEAPVATGYSGDPADAVPGSIIIYKIYYRNDGFAIATSVEVVDKIPPHTEYKLTSATGESVTDILYSNDDGLTFTYTPGGTYVDPNVTNIKWLCEDMLSTTEAATVEFGVVIR